MSLLYFIPKPMTAPPLQHAGLEDRLGGVKLHRRELRGNGPGDRAGLLMADEDGCKATDVVYAPDSQRWTDAGKYWIGVNGTPIKPDSLERPDATIRGYPVKLADGNEWIIPPGNPAMATPVLPHRRRPKPDGTHERVVVDEYADYQAAITPIWRVFTEANGDFGAIQDEVDNDALWDLAERAVGIYYRLGPFEIDALGLLTSDTVGSVIQAALDFQLITEVLQARMDAAKKNEPAPTPDGSPTERGGTG